MTGRQLRQAYYSRRQYSFYTMRFQKGPPVEKIWLICEAVPP